MFQREPLNTTLAAMACATWKGTYLSAVSIAQAKFGSSSSWSPNSAAFQSGLYTLPLQLNSPEENSLAAMLVVSQSVSCREESATTVLETSGCTVFETRYLSPAGQQVRLRGQGIPSQTNTISAGEYPVCTTIPVEFWDRLSGADGAGRSCSSATPNLLTRHSASGASRVEFETTLATIITQWLFGLSTSTARTSSCSQTAIWRGVFLERHWMGRSMMGLGTRFQPMRMTAVPSSTTSLVIINGSDDIVAAFELDDSALELSARGLHQSLHFLLAEEGRVHLQPHDVELLRLGAQIVVLKGRPGFVDVGVPEPEVAAQGVLDVADEAVVRDVALKVLPELAEGHLELCPLNNLDGGLVGSQEDEVRDAEQHEHYGEGGHAHRVDGPVEFDVEAQGELAAEQPAVAVEQVVQGAQGHVGDEADEGLAVAQADTVVRPHAVVVEAHLAGPTLGAVRGSRGLDAGADEAGLVLEEGGVDAVLGVVGPDGEHLGVVFGEDAVVVGPGDEHAVVEQEQFVEPALELVGRSLEQPVVVENHRVHYSHQHKHYYPVDPVGLLQRMSVGLLSLAVALSVLAVPVTVLTLPVIVPVIVPVTAVAMVVVACQLLSLVGLALALMLVPHPLHLLYAALPLLLYLVYLFLESRPG